jgi:hypothetical protein
MLGEFYGIALRKKIYCTVDELRTDPDVWIDEYNQQRPHQGRSCFGKTPMQISLDAFPLAKEKLSWPHDHIHTNLRQRSASVSSSID